MLINFWFSTCGPCQNEFPLMQNNYIVGFQMVNTLEGSNELYAQMLKGVPVNLEEMDLSDPTNTPLKYLCLGKYLLQMHI